MGTSAAAFVLKVRLNPKRNVASKLTYDAALETMLHAEILQARQTIRLCTHNEELVALVLVIDLLYSGLYSMSLF
jgi:hypothetical protein